MMREQYESLAAHDLKEIAKARGIKGISAMKKAAVIEAMLALDEQEKADKEREEKAREEKEPPVEAQKEETHVREQADYATANTKRKGTGRVRPDGKKEGESIKRHVESKEENRQSVMEKRDGAARPQGERTGETGKKADAESREPVHGRNEETVHDGRTQRAEGLNREHRQIQKGESAKGDNASRNAVGRNADTRYNSPYNRGTAPVTSADEDKFPAELDSGITVSGILEVMSDGYGFIRSANYLPGENDVYVAPSQIRRFGLKTGDILEGNTRVRTQNEKFSALLYVRTINGYTTEVAMRRQNFGDMTPIFPDSRLKLERYGSSVAMRIMDLLSPIGKGQRGMIVSPPKAGKTTLLKEVAQAVKRNYPDMHLIILLIDERPEEVTDMRETVEGPNVEVIYSTFDELPDNHKRVSEMVIERAKRLVEHKKDVMILLDSITRLTRAYNLVVPPSGRTLSGGIDPAALHMPKRFFGAARNMREGGSLTILATALVDTGSKMDDVIYEEFKGTGNMELVLDRKLSEKRLFPAIDIPKTSTRREDLLLSSEEMEAINIVRRALNGMKSDDAVDKVLDLFAKTRNNAEFVQTVKKMRFI